MTSRLTLEIQGVPYENIEPLRAFLAQYGLETGGTGSKVRPVVSCKGTTCQYGLIDTFALSEKLHYLFFEGRGCETAAQVQNRGRRLPEQLCQAGSQRSRHHRPAGAGNPCG